MARAVTQLRARDTSLPVRQHVGLSPSPSPIAVPSRLESTTSAAAPTGSHKRHLIMYPSCVYPSPIPQREPTPGRSSQLGEHVWRWRWRWRLPMASTSMDSSGPAFTRMSTDTSDPGLPDQNSQRSPNGSRTSKQRLRPELLPHHRWKSSVTCDTTYVRRFHARA